ECTVMSQKYLGDNFDIHGGGLENAFPHHECEIAQAEGHTGKPFANYWMHNNMVTINGQKMGKSLGNGVFWHELFSGENLPLEKAFAPMSIRFFILQSHYRSTLDFSNEALKAAEKGLKRLMDGIERLKNVPISNKSSLDVDALKEKLYKAMYDDFNSPIAIAHLFDMLKWVAALEKGEEQISKEEHERLLELLKTFVFKILGLKVEEQQDGDNQVVDSLMNLVLDFRKAAKEQRDVNTADKIRDKLKEFDIEIKDSMHGGEWLFEH